VNKNKTIDMGALAFRHSGLTGRVVWHMAHNNRDTNSEIQRPDARSAKMSTDPTAARPVPTHPTICKQKKNHFTFMDYYHDMLFPRQTSKLDILLPKLSKIIYIISLG